MSISYFRPNKATKCSELAKYKCFNSREKLRFFKKIRFYQNCKTRHYFYIICHKALILRVKLTFSHIYIMTRVCLNIYFLIKSSTHWKRPYLLCNQQTIRLVKCWGKMQQVWIYFKIMSQNGIFFPLIWLNISVFCHGISVDISSNFKELICFLRSPIEWSSGRQYWRGIFPGCCLFKFVLAARFSVSD